MKIKSPYHRPNRRIASKGQDQPFFQKQGAESAFFKQQENASSKSEEEEPAAKHKEAEEEATKFKDEEEAPKFKEEEEAKDHSLKEKQEEETTAKEEEEAPAKEEEEAKADAGTIEKSEASAQPQKKDAPAKEKNTHSEQACDQAQIRTAISGAKSLADRATGASTAISLTGGINTQMGMPPTDGEKHHQKWFGAYDPARAKFIARTYQDISKALSGTIATECDNSKKKRNIYAYVYPGGKKKIYICGKFWTAPSSGTNSRPGVILHEIAHEVRKSIGDIGYGTAKAEKLAKKKPHKAIANADNYEYYAETI